MTQEQANAAPRIRLYLAQGVWMAQFVDDWECWRVFGCDTVPTPYTDSTGAGVVWQAVSGRNPGCCVDVADGPVCRTART